MTKPVPNKTFKTRSDAATHAWKADMIIDEVTPLGGPVKILAWHSRERVDG